MCQCHGAPCHQWGLFLFDGTKTYKLVVPQNENYYKYCNSFRPDNFFSLLIYQSVKSDFESVFKITFECK